MAIIPRRVLARPNIADWSRTEWLTFAEAAALLWPEGSPLKSSSLRTAWRAGDLQAVMVARKLLTNLKAIEEMMEASTHKVAAKPRA
jgi:hypothetical protein